jgi:hypothetical protein
MLVGLLMISATIGALAGGAALVFGHGILVALLVYSLTSSTVVLLLCLSIYIRTEDKKPARTGSALHPVRVHSGLGRTRP